MFAIRAGRYNGLLAKTSANLPVQQFRGFDNLCVGDAGNSSNPSARARREARRSPADDLLGLIAPTEGL
jgi:hypothetical protein